MSTTNPHTLAGALSSEPNIKSRLRRYIVENFVFASALAEFGDSDSFLDHHILDSTGFLELISHLEETFGIAVADEEMVPENLDSLDALEGYILRKRQS